MGQIGNCFHFVVNIFSSFTLVFSSSFYRTQRIFVYSNISVYSERNRETKASFSYTQIFSLNTLVVMCRLRHRIIIEKIDRIKCLKMLKNIRKNAEGRPEEGESSTNLIYNNNIHTNFLIW